jgi:hypothetical protein
MHSAEVDSLAVVAAFSIAFEDESSASVGVSKACSNYVRVMEGGLLKVAAVKTDAEKSRIGE